MKAATSDKLIRVELFYCGHYPTFSGLNKNRKKICISGASAERELQSFQSKPWMIISWAI